MRKKQKARKGRNKRKKNEIMRKKKEKFDYE